MLDRETLLTPFNVGLGSIVFNLDHIPAEKLDWKPAPEAKSALEIVNHLGQFISSVNASFGSEAAPFTPVTDVESAKRELTAVGEAFSAALRSATPETLGAWFSEEWNINNSWIATAVVLDAVHHNGQIAYLQTLWGDTEIHFDGNRPEWSIK